MRPSIGKETADVRYLNLPGAPIIGQRDERGARARFIDFPTAAGPRRINIKKKWSFPLAATIFLPPISAIAGFLGA